MDLIFQPLLTPPPPTPFFYIAMETSTPPSLIKLFYGNIDCFLFLINPKDSNCIAVFVLMDHIKHMAIITVHYQTDHTL